MARTWVYFPRIFATGTLAVLFFMALAGSDRVDAAGTANPARTAKVINTNRLIESRNPYLLLHAHNPVDWYSWGPDAIAKAKRENKPIFLSIGYSTCYWCHVAEITIYSNPGIAKLMNQWFVNIKVDREQRPDLDQVYMLATRLMTGHTGWPNNLFLTPDLKPFFAGSYFPPVDDPQRGPGFPAILTALHHAWTAERPRVLSIANRTYAAMRRLGGTAEPEQQVAIRPETWLAKARSTLLPLFDPEYGGLRSPGNASKFPQTPSLELLLAAYRLSRDPGVLKGLTGALDAMALGGLWDHLGNGFYRYGTERTWSVPHFEKMLYDNVQLLRLYADAYQETSSPLYRAVAVAIGDFLHDHMMAPEGGFYSARDSQVDGIEGASYLWTKQEIETLLGTADARAFFRVYALTPLPVRAKGPLPVRAKGPTHNRSEGGVLRVRLPISNTLERTGYRRTADMLAALAPMRRTLLAARDQRPQPATDRKITTALNGMTIGVLLETSAILQKPEYVVWARRAAERIWNLAHDPTTGQLRHEIFDGHAQVDGYLADYAHLGVGFMLLAEKMGEPLWRHRAAQLADEISTRFARDDGTLATAPRRPDLLLALRDTGDIRYPSGTSATLRLLFQLAAATGDKTYARTASRLVRRLGGQLEEQPEAWPSAVVTAYAYRAVLRAETRPPNQNALAGKTSAGTAGRTVAGTAGRTVAGTAVHVHVRAAAKTHPNHQEIAVTIQIDPGYHVNANPASLDYLIPTSVRFEHLIPKTIVYPTSVPFRPAFTADTLEVYEDEVTIVATLPKGALDLPRALDDTHTVHGQITAQACTAEFCLPPADLPFTIPEPGP